jgi:hypothetical protein
MTYILNRLAEPSSWIGLIATIQGMNLLHLGQDLIQSVVAVGTSLAGLVLIVLKDSANIHA